MATARQLLSDFTGGEVSPRVDARADLAKYQSALRRAENVLLSQQGGAILRLGTRYLGAALSSGASPVPDVRLIPWRSGDPAQKEILFEITGTTVRGWQDGALITSGGVPYTLTLPVSVSGEIQATQRGKLLAITSPDHPPFIIRVNGVADWELVLVPLSQYPTRQFDLGGSPPKQGSIYDITFAGFSTGNAYTVSVNGVTVKERRRVQGSIFPQTVPKEVNYSSVTATNIRRLESVIRESSSIKNPDDVTVTYVSGTTYRVTFSGDSGGTELGVVAVAESASLRVEVEPNATGVDGSEPAWSYPTVVTYSGGHYQCIKAHVSAASPTPDTDTTNWLPLAGPPPWESVQPSEAWSNAAISYGLGDRGFPRACAFHEQRLMVGGTPTAPQTFWGSAIGDPLAFLEGVEDDEPLSRDIDATDAPAIRWMTSQQGLIVGTSAGVFQVTGQVTLTPADVSIRPFSADRSAAIQAQVVGNEVLFVSQDRTQLLSFRRNEQVGPYEVTDLTALAEHLGRQRIRRVVYCRQPQPVVYVLTDKPGQLLAITYNRQYDMVGFARWAVDGHIDDIGSLFRDSVGDEVYLLVRRGDRSSVESVAHPSSLTPVDTPALNATVHLDGWVTGNSAGGFIGGLRHLLGKTVTVLNSDGTVQGTGTVALGGAEVESSLTVTNNGWETGDLTGWGVTGASASASTDLARTGTYSLKVEAGVGQLVKVRSANITVTPGRLLRARLYWRGAAPVVLPLVVDVYNAANVLIAEFNAPSFGPASAADWTLAEVTATAPAGAAYMKIGQTVYNPGDPPAAVYFDDVSAWETVPTDGRVAATGNGLVVGQPFVGVLQPMEPVTGNPEGPATGKRKRYSGITARLYQSCLPKINGDRPSDYSQSDFRANPGALRTGEYEVNTAGWDDGAMLIEMDLPHRTEIVALYGDLKVN